MAAAAVLAAVVAFGSGFSLRPGFAAGGPGKGEEGVRLGVVGASSGNAAVAADGPRVVVTWAARAGSSTDVYAAFSKDGGVSFGSPTRVNDVEGDARVSGEQAPRVALGTGVEVVWVSRREGAAVVLAARARVGEHAFAPATTVHAERLTGARGWASLAVARDGAVHVAWLDGRDAQVGRVAANASSTHAAGSPHKAMRQDLYQAVRRPDGTRAEVRVATDACFCCKTAVASGPDGSTYVAWRHIYPPNLRDMAVARSTDGGRTFAAPVRVSVDGWALDGCPDDGPSLAVDARGAVHIAWPTLVPGSTPGKGIFYSYSVDGGRTFAPRVRVDDAGGSAAHPQLAASGDRVLVVWDQGEAPRQVWARAISSDPKGAAWAPRLGQVARLSAAGSAVYPALAATPTSTVVAWTEATPAGSDLRVRKLAR